MSLLPITKPTAAQLKAFEDGAQAKRGGVRDTFCRELWQGDDDASKLFRIMWHGGWIAQFREPGRKITRDDFHLLSESVQVNSDNSNRASRKETLMATRTAEELESLKNDFSKTYTGDPAGLDAAFQSHLETLDAAATTDAPAKAKSSKKGAGKKAGAKAAKPAKAAKAPKAPAAPRPKGFRPTSDDRKAFNAAAAKAAGKDVKAPRLVPQGKGQTYSDFLSGKVLKLDADGNGETKLNVVSAKDTKTILGTVTVTVTKGKVKATGAKA